MFWVTVTVFENSRSRSVSYSAARSFRPELAVILLTGGAADSRGFPLLRKPFAQSDLRRVMAETTGLF
jgi:hypothetical protein